MSALPYYEHYKNCISIFSSTLLKFRDAFHFSSVMYLENMIRYENGISVLCSHTGTFLQTVIWSLLVKAVDCKLIAKPKWICNIAGEIHPSLIIWFSCSCAALA